MGVGRVNGLGLSERVDGEASLGSLLVSVSKGLGMGFGHEKPGSATISLRFGQSPAAGFERCSEGKAPNRTGIDFLDFLDFDFDHDLTDRQPLPGGDA